MTRTVILHGGLQKTGTTSVQFALREAHARLADHGVYVPGPREVSDPRSFGSRAGGLHAIPKELWQSGGRESPSLDLLLADFEVSGCERLFLSSEAIGLLDTDRLIRLKNRLEPDEIKAVLVFRHPLRHARSLYCGRGVPRAESPEEFLAAHPGRWPYAQIAARWREVFGPSAILLRYEDRSSMLAPLLDILGLPPEALEGTATPRRRPALHPALALAAHRLIRTFATLSPAEQRSILYDPALSLEKLQEYRDKVAEYPQEYCVFSPESRARYLESTLEDMAILETYLPTPTGDAGYTRPIEAPLPPEAMVADLLALFARTRLAPAAADYTRA